MKYQRRWADPRSVTRGCISIARPANVGSLMQWIVKEEEILG